MATLASTLKARGIYYGWVIVALAFVVSFTAQIGDWVLTILIKPMQEDLGWSRSGIVGARAISLLAGAATGPIIGKVVDRYGARSIIVAAALTQGVILLLLSRVTQQWHIYLLFFIHGAFITATLVGVAPPTAVANWFVQKRGRALAIALTGASLGGSVFVILGQYLVGIGGWRTAWLGLSIMPWIFSVVPVAMFMRRRPEDMGLKPDGIEEQEAEKRTKAQVGKTEPVEEVSWELGRAIRTSAFWLLAISSLLYDLSLFGFFLHIPSYITDVGFSPATAAIAMSLYSLALLPARFFWGFLVEHIPVRHAIALDCAASAVGLLGFIFLPGWGIFAQPWAIIGLAIGVGFIVGGFRVLGAVVLPDYFGRLHAGAIRGASQPFQAFAQAVGPLLAANLYDTLGSYRLIFLVFVGLYLVGGVVTLFAKPPKGAPALSRM